MERVFIRPIQSLIRSSPAGSWCCGIITGLLTEEAEGTLRKVNASLPPPVTKTSLPPTLSLQLMAKTPLSLLLKVPSPLGKPGF